MAFDLFKKRDENTSKIDKHGITTEDVKRLSKGAGHIISVFEHLYKEMSERLITVSALTGHVCHEAVKANKESFVTVQTNDNREYYFGDDLNYYLLEGPFSILCFVKGYYDAKLRSKSSPDVNSLVQKVTAKIGDAQYRIWNQEEPERLYNRIKECWNGIFKNLAEKYCWNAAEWPVLFGIVLQNILFQSEEEPELLFNNSLESALLLSKMDDKSIAHRNETTAEKTEEDLIYGFFKDGKPIVLSIEENNFIHTSIDTLRDFLKENKIAFNLNTGGPDYKVIHFKMTIQGVLTDVLVAFYLKPKMCSIVFKLPFKSNAMMEAELYRALMSYNCNRRFGSFIYDRRDGEIDYKTDFPCAGGVNKEDFLAAFMISMNSVSNFMNELKLYVVPK